MTRLETYKDNVLNAKDPTVAWARVIATHVTAIDGSGTQKQYTAVNTMIAEFAQIRQTKRAVKHSETAEHRCRKCNWYLLMYSYGIYIVWTSDKGVDQV